MHNQKIANVGWDSLQYESTFEKANEKSPVIIALPAFNEEKNIGSVILLAKQNADEVIVFDDGSTDQTVKVAQLAGASVVSNGRKMGKGSAIQHILEIAREKLPCKLVIMDADGQHDPMEIPVLLATLYQGHDIVIGARKILKSKTPFYRRIGQNILRQFTAILTGKKLVDTESGFRALSEKAISTIKLSEDGFSIETEMILESVKNKLKICEVPISNIYVKDGSTQNPIKHGLSVLIRILVMISERRPLFFFSLGAAVALFLGCFTAARTLAIFSETREIALGTALLSGFLMTTSVYSLFTGLILNILTKNKH